MTTPSLGVPPVPQQQTSPWAPHVAGVSGLLLGPIAGILISWLNLRRLGNSAKAKQLLFYAIPSVLIELYFLIRLPVKMSRIFGLSVTVASYKLFTFAQEPDFKAWQATAGAKPRNGWTSLGWGFLGLIVALTLNIAMVLAFDNLGILPED